jgi:hypothetical protein
VWTAATVVDVTPGDAWTAATVEGETRDVWEAASCTLLPSSILAPPSPLRALTVESGTKDGRRARVGADFLNGATGTRRGLAIPTGQTKDNGSGVVRPVWVACGCGNPVCCGYSLVDRPPPTTAHVLIEVISGTCTQLDGQVIDLMMQSGGPSDFCYPGPGMRWWSGQIGPQNHGFSWCLQMVCFNGQIIVAPTGRLALSEANFCFWDAVPGQDITYTVQCDPFVSISEGWCTPDAFGGFPNGFFCTPCADAVFRFTATF